MSIPLTLRTCVWAKPLEALAVGELVGRTESGHSIVIPFVFEKRESLTMPFPRRMAVGLETDLRLKAK